MRLARSPDKNPSTLACFSPSLYHRLTCPWNQVPTLQGYLAHKKHPPRRTLQ